MIAINQKFEEGEILYFLTSIKNNKVLIPVKITGISCVQFLGKDFPLIRYSAKSTLDGSTHEPKEVNLYRLDELGKFK